MSNGTTNYLNLAKEVLQRNSEYPLDEEGEDYE